jgi:uncharacterized integral membrane protein
MLALFAIGPLELLMLGAVVLGGIISVAFLFSRRNRRRDE